MVDQFQVGAGVGEFGGVEVIEQMQDCSVRTGIGHRMNPDGEHILLGVGRQIRGDRVQVFTFHKPRSPLGRLSACLFVAFSSTRLMAMAAAKGWELEWNDMVHDVNELQEMQTVFSGKSFILRSQLKGCTHKVLQAVGVAAPPTVREA